MSELLQQSGINRLYEDLLTNVVAESRAARENCEQTQHSLEDIERFIRQNLNVDQMVDETLQHMTARIPDEALDAQADWLRSDVGKRIINAESASADWSEEEFARRELALATGSDWDKERQNLVKQSLVAAGTVRFVTAMHSETSALVLQASDCVANEESQALIKEQIEKARVDEAFYAVFLRNDILATAGMIFSELNDSDLEAYRVYADSPAGKTWNDTLLDSIRQVLRDRHLPIHRYLVAEIE